MQLFSLVHALDYPFEFFVSCLVLFSCPMPFLKLVIQSQAQT